MARRVRRAVKKEETKEKDDSKLFAFLATLLSIVGFIIALVAKKDDKYVMFYAKQSLVIFIASVIVWIVGLVLGLMPIIGKIISVVLNVLIAVLWLLSWLYALSGKEKEVPLVGKYARNIKL
jgi:uncharacterized membrane protein